MAPLLDLLRPPPHRGPLIAAGAVLVAVGVALEEIRLRDKLPIGVHLAILALAAGVIFALGLQAPAEGGRPPTYQSVLLVSGLGLLAPALLTLADVLGADFGAFPAGALTWTSLLLAGAALWPAIAKGSSICALIAAIAVGVAVLSFVNWATGASSVTTYRWLLAAVALGFIVVSLLLRGPAARHSEQMVNVAGVAVLSIGLTGLVNGVIGQLVPLGRSSDGLLPDGWELFVFAGGCGLLAVAAVDRAPGAAYLGVANLGAFVASATLYQHETLLYWPAILLALGVGAMITGLRPRSPLPPEPSAYRSGSLPLASRTDEDDAVLRVRDDSPPRP
ncbi:MAG: hypothetical protein ABI611_10510 [Solirubrobacteraceae bacterium]